MAAAQSKAALSMFADSWLASRGEQNGESALFYKKALLNRI